jgi:hypothetical protein
VVKSSYWTFKEADDTVVCVRDCGDDDDDDG